MKNTWDSDIFQTWKECILNFQDCFQANMPELRHPHEWWFPIQSPQKAFYFFSQYCHDKNISVTSKGADFRVHF